MLGKIDQYHGRTYTDHWHRWDINRHNTCICWLNGWALVFHGEGFQLPLSFQCIEVKETYFHVKLSTKSVSYNAMKPARIRQSQIIFIARIALYHQLNTKSYI